MYTSDAHVLLDKEYSKLGESVIIKVLKTIRYKWKSVGRHIDKFNKNYTDWLDMDIISEDPDDIECDTDEKREGPRACAYHNCITIIRKIPTYIVKFRYLFANIYVSL